MSELFREAFRTYYAQQSRKTLEEIGEYANGRNPDYTEANVPRLIQEVCSETPAPRHTRTRQRSLWEIRTFGFRLFSSRSIAERRRERSKRP
jgi:hypothetical protein